jgi:hypothetical protein
MISVSLLYNEGWTCTVLVTSPLRFALELTIMKHRYSSERSPLTFHHFADSASDCMLRKFIDYYCGVQMKVHGMDPWHVVTIEAMNDIGKVYKIVDKEPEIKFYICIKERCYECSWNGTASGNGPVATSCERSSKSEIFGSHGTPRTSWSGEILFWKRLCSLEMKFSSPRQDAASTAYRRASSLEHRYLESNPDYCMKCDIS